MNQHHQISVSFVYLFFCAECSDSAHIYGFGFISEKPEFGSIELHQIGALMNSEIEYLNCSALRHDVIRMYNVKVLTMENPCSINASLVIMVNSQFPSSQQAFNINGKVIKLINNVFTGTEQDHYIVGDHVLLANNKYEGQIQIHEVAGSEIFVISNRFDGNWRVHQYAARRVVLYSNEYYGVHYDFSFPTYYRNTMHNMYSYERLNPTDEYVNLLESLGHINTGFYGPAKNQLPSGSVLEFLEDMISGTKIKRPEESYVIATLRKLTQHL